MRMVDGGMWIGSSVDVCRRVLEVEVEFGGSDIEMNIMNGEHLKIMGEEGKQPN